MFFSNRNFYRFITRVLEFWMIIILHVICSRIRLFESFFKLSVIALGKFTKWSQRCYVKLLRIFSVYFSFWGEPCERNVCGTSTKFHKTGFVISFFFIYETWFRMIIRLRFVFLHATRSLYICISVCTCVSMRLLRVARCFEDFDSVNARAINNVPTELLSRMRNFFAKIFIVNLIPKKDA